jgi:biopolymer transport protein ExbD
VQYELQLGRLNCAIAMLRPDYNAERAFLARMQQTYVITLTGCFVVILMWTWLVDPLLAHGVWPLLDLAQASSGRKAPDREHDAWVSVVANGQLFFDERPVTTRELEAHLHDLIFRRATDPQVFVRVDRAAPFRAVRQVIIAAQRAGRRHVIFMARPPEPSMDRVYD